jgi:hypothetical protein
MSSPLPNAPHEHKSKREPPHPDPLLHKCVEEREMEWACPRGFWESMREILRRILSPLAREEGTENFLSAEFLQEIQMRTDQPGVRVLA